MIDKDYIYFEDEPTDKKTRIVSVRSLRTREELGVIRWYGAWRQYCFYPNVRTIFNPTCMVRIVDEIKAMMAARRTT
jgi:hypothetical protein